MNVILVDRKKYFHHNIAALRGSINKEFLYATLIPYKNLLKYGYIIQAEVEKIIPNDGVYFYGKNEPIKYDYLIICTGSS